MSTVNVALYYAACAADDAYHGELVRAYGSRKAPEMRYLSAAHMCARVEAARLDKRNADAAWLAEMRRARK